MSAANATAPFEAAVLTITELPGKSQNPITQMKTFLRTTILVLAALAAFAPGLATGAPNSLLTAAAMPLEVSPYHVAERGPHHRIWQRITAQTNRLGRTAYHTNSYTELASGVCVQQNGQWVDASAGIVVAADASTAHATNTAHHLHYSANPNTQRVPPLQLVTPDGKILNSRVYGLGYLDIATGRSVLVSELQDCIGQILPPDQVLYTNALIGDCAADILYKNTLAGSEQFIILQQQPPPPEEFGLNSSSTMLEVLTEFFNPPTPIITSNYYSAGPGGPVFMDESLDFGAMKIGPGRAFLMGNNDQEPSVRVFKRWTVLEDRTFLIEQIPLGAISAQLQTLPLPPPIAGTNPPAGAMLRSPRHDKSQFDQRQALNAVPARIPTLHATSTLPHTLTLQPAPAPQFARLVQAERAIRPGFLLDYSILTSQTNFTFQSDTTYYVSGTVNLSGTTTFEGGTVIKYTNQPSAEISVGSGTMVYKTGQYRPAVFTSKDDNTVGETITGSTGNPTNLNAGTYLYTTTTNTNACLRMSYAGVGIQSDSSPSYISHAQFFNCLTAVYTSTSTNYVYAYNVLFSLCSNAVRNANLIGQHITADQIATFAASAGQGAIFTNSILTAVTNWGLAPNLFDCATNSSGAAIYQTTGAGSYYLADSSPYRNAGTANIDTNLLSDLGKRTTFPPVVFFGAAQVGTSMNLTLFPQAQRDTDSSPDLGYHYDPLDYAFGACFWTNVVLTVTPGTAIGTFCTNVSGAGLYGLILDGGGQLISQGTPTSPNWITRYNTVQEQSNTNWSSGVGPCLATSLFFSPAPTIICRFTDFSVLAKDTWLFEELDPHPGILTADFQDCQGYGGTFGVFSYYSPLSLSNCLFVRVDVELAAQTNTQSVIRNNLFWYGNFGFDSSPVTNVVIKDNLFDHTTIPDYSWDYNTYNGGYNAFVTNCDRLLPTMAHDIVLASSPSYQTGPLGSYYYPTNLTSLINAGSTTADQVGLYHYTTTTNQVKETNSTVDIGFHYVAVTNGVPFDFDGDGIPDYLEDANGNGTVDSGETSWQDANDLGLKVIITRPKNNSIIP